MLNLVQNQRNALSFPTPVLSKKVIAPIWIYMVLFITFVTIGLWHGANWTYVIFGAEEQSLMRRRHYALPTQ
jgi:D-alanyl-lipoteichoic acid acyltransferase DltB (MBOAT superfamily)